MEDIVTVLGSELDQLISIDDYYALIWTERYADVGDFVLELPIGYLNHPFLVPDNFITIERSNRIMIITKLTPIFDEEAGDKLVVEGESGETILKLRSTLRVFFYEDGSLQTIIANEFDENIASPTNTNREIPIMTWLSSTDPAVTSITVSDFFDVMSIFDLVKSLCDGASLGFKVEFDIENRILVFSLYGGVDRSYGQVDVPYVIFSNNFDNVISSTYVIDTKDFLNVAIVTTNDDVEALQVVPITLFDPEPSGLLRKEKVIGATDIRRTIPDEPDLTNDEVLSIITQRGYDAILQSIPVGLFDGELDTEGSFKFNEDVFMGDIVACDINDLQTSARLTELMISINESGRSAYASFNFNL